jgi:hypothetical protein
MAAEGRSISIPYAQSPNCRALYESGIDFSTEINYSRTLAKDEGLQDPGLFKKFTFTLIANS